MLNLSDLGLAPATTPSQEDDQAPRKAGLVEIPAGSTVAKALYSVWRGNPVTVVDSPPGAGKSTLVATIAQHLAHGSELDVRIVAPTRAMVRALAERIDHITEKGVVSTVGSAFKGDDLFVDRRLGATQVQLSTLASCRYSAPMCDLMIVDEAYQSTYADVLAGTESATQVLMVGDPGQIGPVITANTSMWERSRANPAARAPEVFSRREDATLLHLPSSYRLGQDTVDAISPLYDFPFTSSRPDVTVDDFDEVESIEVEPSGRLADRKTMRKVVRRVNDLVGSHVTSDRGDHSLTQRDVVVLAARNEQVSMLTAMLNSAGLKKVEVGTADRLQGGEWAAAVAVDPLLGVSHASGHSASLGRLCVMASRHFAHLTWVGSSDWAEVVRDSRAVLGEDYQAHRQVRQRLMGQ